MVLIISIRMGNMLGHGSWLMSWLVARGSRGCLEYLPTYLHTPHTQLGQALTVPTFESLRLTSVDYNPRLQIWRVWIIINATKSGYG